MGCFAQIAFVAEQCGGENAIKRIHLIIFMSTNHLMSLENKCIVKNKIPIDSMWEWKELTYLCIFNAIYAFFVICFFKT